MATKEYDELAKQIIEKVGGVGNIIGLTHCVTRLRFKLKENSKADKNAVNKINGVISVVEGNGYFQVVIGNAVGDVFETIMKMYPKISDEGKTHSEEKPSGNPLTRALNLMSAIVNPVVIALAGAGMIKALLVILTTSLHLIDSKGSTYLILSAASNSVFYFLPLFLAVTSAKAFKCNQFISLAIVAALLEPNFTGLMKNAGDITSFLGMPVVLMKYAGTFLPAILSIYVYSKLEKLLKKFIPKSIELFALSMVALLVMVPLTVLVIGPVGVTLANGLGAFVNLLSAKSGLLTGLIVGAGWTFLVILGIHWGVVPIMVNNIATYGYDVIRPMIAAATFASAGAAFGVFLKSKKKENKAFALTSTIPALLGGITEPIIFGLSVKYRRPLIAQIIGGGIAGAFMGAMHTKAIVYVFPALTTLPAFIGPTFIFYLIGITMAFVITAIVTYVLGFKEDMGEDEFTPSIESNEKVLDLNACVKGDVVKLEDVKDEVFATKAMGDGIGILPQEGILYAPAKGTVVVAFPTGHAVGILTDNGIEVLMHIGINTVELEGKYFELLIAANQRVEKGQPLVKFDMAKIKEAGYDLTTIMVITNMDAVESVEATAKTHVTKDEIILSVMRK